MKNIINIIPAPLYWNSGSYREEVYFGQMAVRSFCPTTRRIDVPVVSHKGKPLGETRPVFDQATFHVEPVYVRALIKETEPTIDRLTSVLGLIRDQVHTWNPGLELCPCSGYPRKVRKDGKDHLQLDLLFARTGEKADLRSLSYAYRIALDQHQTGHGHDLGRIGKVYVVDELRDLIGDGMSIVRASSLHHVPGYRIAKIKMKEHADLTPGAVVKGLALFVNDTEFDLYARAVGLPSGDDFSVLASKDSVKFTESTIIDSVLVGQVASAPRKYGRRMPFPFQVLLRASREVVDFTMPITEELIESAKTHYISALDHIADLYRDETGMSVLSAIDSEYRDIVASRCDEDLDGYDYDRLLERCEELTATSIALRWGIRLNDSEFLGQTLPTLFDRRRNSLKVPGGTFWVIPDAVARVLYGVDLAFNEVIAPKFFCQSLNWQIGQKGTGIRMPYMSTECRTLKLAGFTEDLFGADLPVVIVNASAWKLLNNGDFDGDFIMLFPHLHAVDDMVQVVDALFTGGTAKNKAKEAKTIANAVASAIKGSEIGTPNMVIDMAILKGRDYAPAVRGVQARIDCIKHAVNPPEVAALKAACGFKEWETTHPIVRILSGKIGDRKGVTENSAPIKYNAMAEEALRMPVRVPWLNAVRRHVPIIVAKNASIDTVDRRRRRFYDHALIRAGRVDLLDNRANFEDSCYMPVDISRKYHSLAQHELEAISRIPGAKALAYRVYERYVEVTSHLRNGEIRKGYDLLKVVNEYLTSHPETAGHALRYLYIACGMSYRWAGKTHLVDPALSNGKPLIRRQRMFSFFPPMIGTFNIRVMNGRLGALPRYSVTVAGGALPALFTTPIADHERLCVPAPRVRTMTASA